MAELVYQLKMFSPYKLIIHIPDKSWEIYRDSHDLPKVLKISLSLDISGCSATVVGIWSSLKSDYSAVELYTVLISISLRFLNANEYVQENTVISFE